MNNERELELLLILSLGRSGSTFLARTLSNNSDYHNAGENRFFWQELVKKPKELHPEEIARFFNKKPCDSKKILDKTPELYRLITQINFGNHSVHYIELVRSPDAIKASRRNFIHVLRQPKRIFMRIRKYHWDYGWRWFIPVVQRWYLLGAVVGLKRGQAFRTGGSGLTVYAERGAFDKAVYTLRENVDVLKVDYDDFDYTVLSLRTLGFTDDQLQSIKASYTR